MFNNHIYLLALKLLFIMDSTITKPKAKANKTQIKKGSSIEDLKIKPTRKPRTTKPKNTEAITTTPTTTTTTATPKATPKDTTIIKTNTEANKLKENTDIFKIQQNKNNKII